jgi:signal peptidase I
LRDFRDAYGGTVADESLRRYVGFDTNMVRDYKGGEQAGNVQFGDFIRSYRKATVELVDGILASSLPPAEAAREINDGLSRYWAAYERRFVADSPETPASGNDGAAYAGGAAGSMSESQTSADDLAAEKVGRVFASVLTSPQYLIYILILVCVMTFVRGYLVPSGSMIPTLREGDRILTLKRYLPDGQTYARGDIVCFHRPVSGEVYVKRIVAIGGDNVVINDQGLFVNGNMSPYQGGGTSTVTGTWNLGDDEYFMMGDNRVNSEDSRYIGTIKASAVIGKVDCIYWPLDRFEKFDGSGIFGL